MVAGQSSSYYPLSYPQNPVGAAVDSARALDLAAKVAGFLLVIRWARKTPDSESILATSERPGKRTTTGVAARFVPAWLSCSGWRGKSVATKAKFGRGAAI